jgi:DNA polymerase-3 subunit gamma/tau
MRALAGALETLAGGSLKLQIDVVDTAIDTPAQRLARAKVERQSEAEATVARDPFVQDLIRDFDARVIPGSIRSN